MKESNSRKGAYIAIAVLSAISILVACTSNNESADSSKTENSSLPRVNLTALSIHLIQY